MYLLTVLPQHIQQSILASTLCSQFTSILLSYHNRINRTLYFVFRVAMPILWNAYIGKKVIKDYQLRALGNSKFFDPSRQLPAPHPLQTVFIDFTDKDSFAVDVSLKLNAEAK